MEFEWDEIKREENLNRDEGGKPRGIDFVDVIPLFSDERSICVEDTRKDYGECRFNLYGCAMDGNLYKVTFTRRNHRIRIISARRAINGKGGIVSRKKEEKLTQAIFTEDGQVLIKQSDGTYSPAKSETDWQRFQSMTDEEVEEIARADKESPPMSDKEWAKAVRVPVKVPISVRVDDDVLNFLKAQGKGYQTRINTILRTYMDAQKGKHTSC